MKIEEYLKNNIPSLEGKTYVVTGANSGLGFSLTKQLSVKNAHVIMACRNEQKATKAIESIKKEQEDANLTFMRYDQADKASIHQFAENLKSIGEIDAIVLNAGIFHPKKGLTTKDGYPLTVGTNFLGVYFLVQELEELVKEGKIKRIVFISSFVRHFGKTRHPEKYFLRERRSLIHQYSVSKWMMYAYALLLMNRFYGQCEVTIAHPGLASTNIVLEEHSSLPKWVQKAGKKFLQIFANSSDKSALSFAVAATKSPANLGYFCPRGLFHMKGFPKEKRLHLRAKKYQRLEKALLNL